jgi:hypothetical protein
MIDQGEGYGTTREGALQVARSQATVKLDLQVANIVCANRGCTRTVTAEPDFDGDEPKYESFPDDDSPGFKCTVIRSRQVTVDCAIRTGSLPAAESPKKCAVAVVRTLLLAVISVVVIGTAACGNPDSDLPSGVSILESGDFGRVFVGDSLRKTIRVRNSVVPGNVLRVSSSVLDPGTVFRAAGSHPPPAETVVTGASLDLDFVFRPPQPGPFRTTWRVSLNGRPFTRDIRGEGVLAGGENISVTRGRATPRDGLDFGDVFVGTDTQETVEIQVIRVGTTVRIAPPTITQAVDGVFTIANAAVAGTPGTFNAPRDFLSGQRLVITLRFTPGEDVHYTGTLTIDDGNGMPVFKLFLKGNGVEAGD